MSDDFHRMPSISRITNHGMEGGEMIEERVNQKIDGLMKKSDGKRLSFIKNVKGRDAPNAG